MHFGAQIPGTKPSPGSGPLVSFNTYGPESGLDSVPGIWAPKRARIPAQKNRRSRPHPSQKTGRLLLHSCLGNLTSSMALLMLGPPPCCRYLGGTYKPSSPLFTASLGAVEALVCSSGTAAAPEQQVTTLHRQKQVPHSGFGFKPVFCWQDRLPLKLPCGCHGKSPLCRAAVVPKLPLHCSHGS